MSIVLEEFYKDHVYEALEALNKLKEKVQKLEFECTGTCESPKYPKSEVDEFMAREEVQSMWHQKKLLDDFIYDMTEMEEWDEYKSSDDGT